MQAQLSYATIEDRLSIMSLYYYIRTWQLGKCNNRWALPPPDSILSYLKLHASTFDFISQVSELLEILVFIYLVKSPSVPACIRLSFVIVIMQLFRVCAESMQHLYVN